MTCRSEPENRYRYNVDITSVPGQEKNQAMIYDAGTPEDYLAALDEDWRKEKLLDIRAHFLSIPGVTEGMEYKMLQYKRGDDPVAIMNAQKGYVSVYMDDLNALDPDGTLLAGMNCGKSCLRLRKTDGIDVVKALAARRLGL